MDLIFCHCDINVSIISYIDVYHFDLDLVIMNATEYWIDLELIGSWLWLKDYILCELNMRHDISLFGDKPDEKLFEFED